MKRAICNVAHPGSMESLQMMLGPIGYECMTLDSGLEDQLRSAGCDTIVSLHGLAKGWGWELQNKYRAASSVDMACKDVIYIDVKAHRNYHKVVDRWPHLKDRILWYFINGGKPADYSDSGRGDETNPPCPVLTPDRWYQFDTECGSCGWMKPRGMMLFTGRCPKCGKNQWQPTGWAGRAYSMWPPFKDSNRIIPRALTPKGPPICLVHNLKGWGYGDFLPLRHSIGLETVGGYGSPDGLTPHYMVFQKLADALCMVHLKSVDAPGYSLYEAMMTGCPVVIPERFIHRCRAHDLLIPDVTCLTFDRYDEPEPLHPEEGMLEIIEQVDRLRDLKFNREIGEEGKKRLKEIMWSSENAQDVKSLKGFFSRHFA